MNYAIKSLVIVRGWFSNWDCAWSPSHQCTVARFLASRICYYGSSVCFRVSYSHFLPPRVLYTPFPLSLAVLLSVCICCLEYWCCWFCPFHYSSFLFFKYVFPPCLSHSLSFFVCPCSFSPVWPGRGHPYIQCMYYYLPFFFPSLSLLHHSNLLPLLAVLHHFRCMWLLTLRWFFFAGRWNFALPPVHMITRLSRFYFVLLILQADNW